jgi:hypothetical protein
LKTTINQQSRKIAYSINGITYARVDGEGYKIENSLIFDDMLGTLEVAEDLGIKGTA